MRVTNICRVPQNLPNKSMGEQFAVERPALVVQHLRQSSNRYRLLGEHPKDVSNSRNIVFVTTLNQFQNMSLFLFTRRCYLLWTGFHLATGKVKHLTPRPATWMPLPQ